MYYLAHDAKPRGSKIYCKTKVVSKYFKKCAFKHVSCSWILIDGKG